jgi:hypothetical protein
MEVDQYLPYRLASMITGQYTGKVFAKQQWNQINSYFESNNPEALKNNFTDKIGTTVNSCLSKIYILTTKAPSASELVINGLKPYDCSSNRRYHDRKKCWIRLPYMTPLLLVRTTETQITVMPCSLLF